MMGRRHGWWNLVLVALSAAGSYVTFRRGAYLEFGACALTALAICRRWRITTWLPWIYLMIGMGLAGVGTIVGQSQGQGILSAESLSERHDAWNTVLERWLAREDHSLLFGTGLAQIESDEIDYFLVDNAFLAVGAQIGLMGLILWCWVMYALWSDVLATAWSSGSTLAIAVAALFSTWMMRGMFDPLFSLYPLYAFLVFWSVRDVAPTSRAQSAIRSTTALT
jgi:O-Antigen ligase